MYYTYTVKIPRRAEFPLDMLRYDDAEAASVQDQVLIDRLKVLGSDREHLPKDVFITLRTSSRFAPHIKRWESFEVTVVDSTNPFTAIEMAIARAPQASRLDHLSIERRSADAYDITHTPAASGAFKAGRVARIRGYASGVWRIVWEGDNLGMTLAEGLTDRDFRSPQQAYAAIVENMLA